jgi:hypothetical protein
VLITYGVAKLGADANLGCDMLRTERRLHMVRNVFFQTTPIRLILKPMTTRRIFTISIPSASSPPPPHSA